MVINLAAKAGVSLDKLYFNIEQVGNLSAASIPMAIHDAVRDGVIAQPLRVFAPGYGAGAVGGYSVMRVDPAIVATGLQPAIGEIAAPMPATAAAIGSASENVRIAFAG